MNDPQEVHDEDLIVMTFMEEDEEMFKSLFEYFDNQNCLNVQYNHSLQSNLKIIYLYLCMDIYFSCSRDSLPNVLSYH